MGRPASLNERALIALVHDRLWEIDADGRVWILASRFGSGDGNSRVLKVRRRRIEHRTPQGYLQVRAMVNGKRLYSGAHRLVWQYHHGDIPVGFEVNHLNGLKDDNRPENLQICRAGENLRHAHASGLIDQHGERNPAAKLTNNEVAQIRMAYSRGGWTMFALAARFGVSFQTISRIVRGQRRAKQGGPTLDDDQRHDRGLERDSVTGRYVGKKAAGRLLDCVQHDGAPA